MVKNPPASAGDPRDMGLILGSGRCPGWKSYLLDHQGSPGVSSILEVRVSKAGESFLEGNPDAGSSAIRLRVRIINRSDSKLWTQLWTLGAP